MHHWNYTSEDSWPYLSSSFQSLLPLFPLNIFKIDLQKKRSLINFYPNSIFSLPWIEQMLFFLSKISYQSYLINSWDLWGAFLGSKVTVPLIISSAALGKKKPWSPRWFHSLWSGEDVNISQMVCLRSICLLLGFLWKTGRSILKQINDSFCLHPCPSVCLSVSIGSPGLRKPFLPCLDNSIHLKSFMLSQRSKIPGNWKKRQRTAMISHCHIFYTRRLWVIGSQHPGLKFSWIIHYFPYHLMLSCFAYVVHSAQNLSFLIHSLTPKYLFRTGHRAGTMRSVRHSLMGKNRYYPFELSEEQRELTESF